MNILWEMAAAEHILEGIMEGAKGLINGVTCGAGMPYKVAEISAHFGIYYYPIVSSARAFRALWLRAYNKHREWLGGVVYEDPWLAGGHNGLSNSEDPKKPEDPYPRVAALRSADAGIWPRRNADRHGGRRMVAFGMGSLARQPRDWPDRVSVWHAALLTQESPISNAWKKKLFTLKSGDVFLNRFSPTGFYSSAVNNPFMEELRERSERQIAYSLEILGEHTEAFQVGAIGKPVYLTPGDLAHAKTWITARFHARYPHARQHADLCDAETGAGNSRRPDRLHGLSFGLPFLQLVAERSRDNGPQARSAFVLHPENVAEHQP